MTALLRYAHFGPVILDQYPQSPSLFPYIRITACQPTNYYIARVASSSHSQPCFCTCACVRELERRVPQCTVRADSSRERVCLSAVKFVRFHTQEATKRPGLTLPVSELPAQIVACPQNLPLPKIQIFIVLCSDSNKLNLNESIIFFIF